MPRARRKVKRQARLDRMDLKSTTRAAVGGLIQISIGILLFLALRDSAGKAGAIIQRILTFLFGSWGIIFPIFLVCSGLLHWIAPSRRIEIKRSTGLILCLLAFLGFMHIGAPLEEIGTRRDELAGAIGFMMSLPFLTFLSRSAGYTVLGAAFLIGLLITFEPDLGALFQSTKELFFSTGKEPRRSLHPPLRAADLLEEEEEEERLPRRHARAEEDADEEDLEEEGSTVSELNIVRPAFARSAVTAKANKLIKEKLRKRDMIEMKDTRFEEWTFPSYDMLDDAVSQLTVKDEELKRQAQRIEEKLREFEVDVTMKDARPGPTVTQFTLEPAEGIRLSKIAALKDDLALALAAPACASRPPSPASRSWALRCPTSRVPPSTCARFWRARPSYRAAPPSPCRSAATSPARP